MNELCSMVFCAEVESKNHMKENLRRIREIQKTAQQQTNEETKQPVKALWKLSKFDSVPSRVKEQLQVLCRLLTVGLFEMAVTAPDSCDCCSRACHTEWLWVVCHTEWLWVVCHTQWLWVVCHTRVTVSGVSHGVTDCEWFVTQSDWLWVVCHTEWLSGVSHRVTVSGVSHGVTDCEWCVTRSDWVVCRTEWLWVVCHTGLSPWLSWLTPQCTLPVLAARQH